MSKITHRTPQRTMKAKPLETERVVCATQKSGFSLVEVVIAIGIFAFTVVGIVYLLGASLSSSRDSARDSALATALVSVDSAVRTSGTSLMLTGTNIYFDLYGNLLSGSNSTGIYYQASVQPVNSGSVAALTNLDFVNYSNPTYQDINYPALANYTAAHYFLWRVTFYYPYSTTSKTGPFTTNLLIGGSAYDPTPLPASSYPANTQL